MSIPPQPFRMPTDPVSMPDAKSSNGWPFSSLLCLSKRVYLAPHLWHDIVCAWNLLSEGEAYSFVQSGHMGKSDMLVLALSNGRSEMTVKRAPHSVQLVNGNRCRLFPSLPKSLTQLLHIAVSVGIKDTLRPSWLSTILKSLKSSSTCSNSARSILASAGRRLFSSAMNFSASLSTCRSTLEPLFRTKPFKPRALATLNTVGLT